MCGCVVIEICAWKERKKENKEISKDQSILIKTTAHTAAATVRVLVGIRIVRQLTLLLVSCGRRRVRRWVVVVVAPTAVAIDRLTGRASSQGQARVDHALEDGYFLRFADNNCCWQRDGECLVIVKTFVECSHRGRRCWFVPTDAFLFLVDDVQLGDVEQERSALRARHARHVLANVALHHWTCVVDVHAGQVDADELLARIYRVRAELARGLDGVEHAGQALGGARNALVVAGRAGRGEQHLVELHADQTVGEQVRPVGSRQLVHAHALLEFVLEHKQEVRGEQARPQRRGGGRAFVLLAPTMCGRTSAWRW